MQEDTFTGNEELFVKFLQEHDLKWMRKTNDLYEQTHNLYEKRLQFLFQQLPQEVHILSKRMHTSMFETCREIMKKADAFRAYSVEDIEQHIQKPMSTLNRKLIETNMAASRQLCTNVLSQLYRPLAEKRQNYETFSQYSHDLELVIQKYLKLARGPAKFVVLKEFIDETSMTHHAKQKKDTLEYLERKFADNKRQFIWKFKNKRDFNWIESDLHDMLKVEESDFFTSELDCFLEMFEEMKDFCSKELDQMKQKQLDLMQRLPNKLQSQQSKGQKIDTLQDQFDQLLTQRALTLKELNRRINNMENNLERKRLHTDMMQVPEFSMMETPEHTYVKSPILKEVQQIFDQFMKSNF